MGSDCKADTLVRDTTNSSLQNSVVSPQPVKYSDEGKSINATSALSQKPTVVTERLNLPYSTNASDLRLDARSPDSNYLISNFDRYKARVSEVVPQQLSEPENSTPDKSQYNLFNPTPRKYWRDFSTDRPDKTETPFTVDAGNFTMEADLFIYTKTINKADDTLTESFNYFVPNFKVGLTNNIDLQIIPEVNKVVRTKLRDGSRQEISGFGDTTVRLKVNFWGNDDGDTAFGVLPFVKFPTNQNSLGNSSIEGGIIFPFAVKLSDTWDVGMQTEADFNRNADDSSYKIAFVNTISFGHELSDLWSTYFELYTSTGIDKGFVATFDTGLKYLLTKNIQLDAGVNIGLTEAADAIQPFLGVSVRF